MHGDEFKRRKEGEQHVELLCPLNKYKLNYIERFRKEAQNGLIIDLMKKYL